MMDETKRSQLRKCREKIVKDLEVEHILDELYSGDVLNETNREQILLHQGRTNKVRCLLDILSTKTNEAFNMFVKILDFEYSWLAKDLMGVSSDRLNFHEETNDEMLILGDIPQLPHNYVPREKEMTELKSKLDQLKRGSYVVLYGFAGFGKSILAVSTVQSMHYKFNSHMYFVNAGEAKNKNDIANQLYRLCVKLDVTLNEKMSNLDIGLMRDALKRKFVTEPYKEALLILDDVTTTGLIEAFNFCCKVLVTTRDKTLVPNNLHVDYFELNKGFRESESLEMFITCTEQVKNLNKECRTVHDLCKGYPMIISLIGITLKDCENEVHVKRRLDGFINMLSSKRNGQKKYPKNSEYHLYDVIKDCLSKLSKECYDCYMQFALFVEDVNITPQVLQVILEKTEYEVEDIIMELQNKSLLAHAYNAQLQSNVYGIHDLMLSYLKQELSNTDKIKMHNNLVDNYLKKSGGDYSKLPNDNYIYTYIGYHLSEAARIAEFPTVYFNLNFIGAKIRACGIADLIGDYKRYMKYITNNEDPVYVKKLKAFEMFVQEYGQDVHRYRGVDIVQCALQQPLSSEVHEAALEIAYKQCRNTLYLQTQFFGKTVYIAHTLDMKDDVGATCYAHKTNTILIGIASGEIQLWNHSYKTKLGTFKGHTQKVTYLQLTSDNETNKFLSVSEDGLVKVWSLEDACQINSGHPFDTNGFDHISPSSRIRQSNWMNFFSDNLIVDSSTTFSLENDNLTCACFSTDNCHIVAGSETGVVTIWRLADSEKIFTVVQPGKAVICCTFSLRDTLVMFASENVIYVYDAQRSEYLSHFVNDVRTTYLLVVPKNENKIVAISDKSISIWLWKVKNREHGVDLNAPQCHVLESREDAAFICGAVTWDGFYAVAASTDRYIRMWNIETKEKVKEFQEPNGSVMCLDTFLNEKSNSNVMYILLSGLDNRTVKQWHINSMENTLSTSTKLLPNFSTCWCESVPLVAAINTDDVVQVFNGHALISETEKMEGPRYIAFSPDGREIAIGLENGRVIVFEFRNKKYHSVMDLKGPVTYIEYLVNHESTYNGYSDLPNEPKFIIVAASQNTCLMVCKDRKSTRFKQPETAEGIAKGKASVTIKCFLLEKPKCIVSVDMDGSVKFWCNEIRDVLVSSHPKSTLTMCEMSKKQDLLVLTFSDGRFRLYDIIVQSETVQCEYKQGHTFGETLRSCSFSDDGSLLALGADSGSIMLWHIVNDVMLTKLELHNSWVRHLIFSPTPCAGAPLVLVSVGEQVVWWDISYVCRNSMEKFKRRSRNRGSMRLESLENLTISAMETLSVSDREWVDKTGRESMPELLAAIKIGHYASAISASPKFNCFVTVDAGGLMYIMNILKPPKDDLDNTF